MRNKVELLAPAGSPEGIRAAVQSGAGAVYMGFGMFNARRNAQGFSHDEMADAIAYCRARDVKTNITLNILAGDRELEDALEDAKFLYEAGADALIIQDLGLARLIHAHAPDFALHASTQMTIHTLDAAKQARDIGFSRVVLSRECSREEIKLITEQAGVETEVFVHGALCMCYSGQCYLSAVIGQRSGNRGLCAQPCRLPYSGGYPLSLKDLMLAGHVAELSDWGVSSLKIEGRMKRPEYAAIVTKVYSDLLREHRRPTAEERDILRRVFSRDGFTDRRRERFPLLNEFGCRNTLLNSRPLCLREDFARLGVQTARLQFTIESPEECVRIARAFLSGAPLDGEFTNGLYKRGVE